MQNSLYSISMNLRDILQKIDDEGEVTPELEQQLVITQEQLQEKGINYALAIKHFDGNVDLIDKEIERLTALKKRNEAMADKLKDKIKSAMVEFGVEKIETATLKLSLRKSEETVITDFDSLPSRYKVVKTTESPDKKAIKEDFKLFGSVVGATVIEKKNLIIK